MKDEGTSPIQSTPASVERPEASLERCLTAYDERGEAGLQAELDRMYPGTRATSPEGAGVTMESDPEPNPEYKPRAIPWDGEIPGTRVALGHGMYAFDADGPVRMHVVVGPEYGPLVETEPSDPPDVPPVEGPAAITSITSPEFAASAIKELRDYHAAVARVKSAAGSLPTAKPLPSKPPSDSNPS